MPYGFGVFGLLVFILDIYVIYLIVESSADTGAKVLWIILVILLPVIGPILYFLLGQKTRV